MTPDPHIFDKIDSCTSLEELGGMVDGFRLRGEEPTSEVAEAIARRRVELQRRART
ncbi:hypothetical protein GCM10007385_35300 [Tateyamaria omphalii]|uniref:hypothetical protein n=1 Tax=Tateyamaria omphalii TaxID=299262 RepID=UPI00167213D0|nr:hypothetical protein [Tateyamaria omphalii]GGX63108.1 hypothetical protein GCM10007385_35300 [Tateyamaria omphalii]